MTASSSLKDEASSSSDESTSPDNSAAEQTLKLVHIVSAYVSVHFWVSVFLGLTIERKQQKGIKLFFFICYASFAHANGCDLDASAIYGLLNFWL